MQYHVQYQNDRGNIITLSCCRSAEGVSLGVIPAGDRELNPQPVSVNGFPGELYLEEREANLLVWAEDGLLLSILGDCSAEELAAMAESVEAVPPSQAIRHPGWIPMGYRYTGGSTGTSQIENQYRKGDGDEIRFTFSDSTETETKERNELQETVTGLNAQRVLVNGQPAELYSAADGIRYLIWNGQEAGEL